MTLHPQAEGMLKKMEADGAPDISEMSVPRARLFVETTFAGMFPNPEPMAEVGDFTVPGPAGRLLVRLYKLEDASAPPPLIVFFHGGSFVMGSIESYDPICRALAGASGCAVASVAYRLAPETAFPRPRRTATRRPRGSPRTPPSSGWTGGASRSPERARGETSPPSSR